MIFLTCLKFLNGTNWTMSLCADLPPAINLTIVKRRVGCLPLTKVNGTWLFGSFQGKIFESNGISEKVALFCGQNYQTEIRAFAAVFWSMEMICANGKRDSGLKSTRPDFCLPFAQTVKQPFSSTVIRLLSSTIIKPFQRLIRWSRKSLEVSWVPEVCLAHASDLHFCRSHLWFWI